MLRKKVTITIDSYNDQLAVKKAINKAAGEAMRLLHTGVISIESQKTLPPLTLLDIDTDGVELAETSYMVEVSLFELKPSEQT